MIEVSATIAPPEPKRLLVYDVETYATGFADPQWVPQVVTCIAWKWYGEPSVRVATTTRDAGVRPAKPSPMPHLEPKNIERMLEQFLPSYETADAVITYNGARFDQPVLNAMAWYCRMPPIAPTTIYDLHAFGKVKGMKKGLDNVAVHLGVTEEKQQMNHAQWQAAYLEPGWPTIKARAVSDVVLTEAVFDAVKAQHWLKPARKWSP